MVAAAPPYAQKSAGSLPAPPLIFGTVLFRDGVFYSWILPWGFEDQMDAQIGSIRDVLSDERLKLGNTRPEVFIILRQGHTTTEITDFFVSWQQRPQDTLQILDLDPDELLLVAR